jgi:putative transposase
LTLTVKRPDGSTQERVIPMAVRRLARKIMSAVLKRRRKPSMRHIGMVVDHRAAVLAQANKSSSFPLWIELVTLERKLKKDGAPSADFVKIAVPLKTYERFDGRKGQRKNALQISQDREGRIAFGVVTDIASGIAERQADPKTAYVPEIDFVSLDFGLKTLVATDRGDLRGRGFLQRLKHYDELIVTLVRNVQRSGMKPRQSKRYCKLVERLRGFIKTEVCRVLNALVERLKPGMIVVERLRFHSPELSKRLNRIVQNCGRKVVADRLKALGDEFAIASEELNPAYSSQTCSSCGYMDAWNRRDQRRFECLWCGLKINADVNAGRNLGGRRWSLPGSFGRTKGEALSEATRRFAERRERPRSLAPEGLPQGGQGPAADPRWTNPCFKDWAAEARSSPNPDGCAAGTEKCRQTQALAA